METNCAKQENRILSYLNQLEKSVEEVSITFQKISTKLDCVLTTDNPKGVIETGKDSEELSPVNSKIRSLINRMNGLDDYLNDFYSRIQI